MIGTIKILMHAGCERCNGCAPKEMDVDCVDPGLLLHKLHDVLDSRDCTPFDAGLHMLRQAGDNLWEQVVDHVRASLGKLLMSGLNNGPRGEVSPQRKSPCCRPGCPGRGFAPPGRSPRVYLSMEMLMDALVLL